MQTKRVTDTDLHGQHQVALICRDTLLDHAESVPPHLTLCARVTFGYVLLPETLERAHTQKHKKQHAECVSECGSVRQAGKNCEYNELPNADRGAIH